MGHLGLAYISYLQQTINSGFTQLGHLFGISFSFLISNYLNKENVFKLAIIELHAELCLSLFRYRLLKKLWLKINLKIDKQNGTYAIDCQTHN